VLDISKELQIQMQTLTVEIVKAVRSSMEEADRRCAIKPVVQDRRVH